jgi:hypothetical protein
MNNIVALKCVIKVTRASLFLMSTGFHDVLSALLGIDPIPVPSELLWFVGLVLDQADHMLHQLEEEERRSLAEAPQTEEQADGK